MSGRMELVQGLPKLVPLARDSLLSTGWLSTTSHDFREALLSAAIIRVAVPGTEFMHAGDETGGLVGIASGTVEVSFEAGHPDTRAIYLGHAGFWSGYKPLLGQRRAISLTARSETLWALIPQQSVERMLAETPEWWRHIATHIDSLCDISNMTLVDLTRQSSEARAVAMLMRLAGCRHIDPPASADLELLMSQTDMAAMAVMSRNTFNGIVGRLVDMGLVELGYRSIRILKPAALRDILSREE